MNFSVSLWGVVMCQRSECTPGAAGGGGSVTNAPSVLAVGEALFRGGEEHTAALYILPNFAVNLKLL